MHELLAVIDDGTADGFGDLHGGRGIHLHGEEGFAHGDLDLVVIPRDELAVAADDFGGDHDGLERAGVVGVGVGERSCAFAALCKTAGDIVGVVTYQRPLDDLINFFGAQHGGFSAIVRRALGDLLGHRT